MGNVKFFMRKLMQLLQNLVLYRHRGDILNIYLVLILRFQIGILEFLNILHVKVENKNF